MSYGLINKKMKKIILICNTGESHFMQDSSLKDYSLFDSYAGDAKKEVYKFVDEYNKNNKSYKFEIDSPYVLYAFNNCIMKGFIENSDKSVKNIPALNPKEVEIYDIKNNELRNIQDKDGLLDRNNFDKEMKKIMDDFYKLINFYKEDEKRD